MLTDPERGLTVEAVRKELETLDLQQVEERDDLARIQRKEKTALTASHRKERERLAKTHGKAREEVESLLAVLRREAADTESDTVDAKPDAPPDSS